MADRSTTGAALRIFDVLRELDTPRDAANALAFANTLLIEEAEDPEIRSAENVARMMDEMKDTVIKNWTARNLRSAS